jgi:hypothetical protein
MFNDKFNAIRLELDPNDLQTGLQLLHAYQEKLSGNSATATTLASYTHLREELGRPVDLADCMAVIARHDNLVFRCDEKGQTTTITAIAGDPQVNVAQGTVQGMALGRGRGVEGVGGAGGVRSVRSIDNLGPRGGRESAVGTHTNQCPRCRSFGHWSYSCPRPREASAASALATPISAVPTSASTAVVQPSGN